MVGAAHRAAEEDRKSSYIDTYIPFVGEALQEMLGFPNTEKDKLIATLRKTFEKGKVDGENQ